jgi:hypothetical protein
MFHQSVVGAVVPMAMTLPAAPVVWSVYSLQYVSLTAVSIHWSSGTWPVGRVRAVALSQSAPTANTRLVA